DQVENAAERLDADRHGHRGAGVDDLVAAPQAVGRTERHGPHLTAAEVLGDLAPEGLLEGFPLNGAPDLDPQGVVDRGQLILGELGVERRADHLGDAAGVAAGAGSRHRETFQARALAPPTMSSSSIVMWVWRARLYSRGRILLVSSDKYRAAFIAAMRSDCS